MDEKTQSLLLKLRKDATAGFGLTDWQRVLQAVGFRLEVAEKVRNSIERVVISAPNGEKLEVSKQPNYRRIVLYGIKADGVSNYTPVAWARAKGFDLPGLAAKALGMPTLAAEQEERDYKARDWTNTGTCGVCEQNVKMRGGGGAGASVLVLHGYQRPGYGYIVGSCYGVGLQPHELSPEAAAGFLRDALVPALDGARSGLANLRSGAVKTLVKTPANPRLKREATHVNEGDTEWPRFLERAISDAEAHIRHVERDVAYYSKKVADWKLDDLPEVKLAKRYGPK